MIYWKLIIIMLFGFIVVTFRDHLTNWMKVISIILIIGGTCWSALTEPSEVPRKIK